MTPVAVFGRICREGVRHQVRFVIDKAGVLDTKRMKPFIPARENTEVSILAEIGVKACQNALERAGKSAADVDGVIVAASNLQRGYPAVAVEIQDALGIEDGFGFDMNVALLFGHLRHPDRRRPDRRRSCPRHSGGEPGNLLGALELV